MIRARILASTLCAFFTRFFITEFLLCALLCSAPVFAAEEMTVSEFLDAVQEYRLSDEQIHDLMGGRMLDPLDRAQELGRAAVVRRLLSARDANGDTALIKAVASNDIDTARMLLKAGAHPNGANPKNILKVVVPGHGDRAHIRNPLSIAALDTANQEMVRLLLDYGAYDREDDGRTLNRLATTAFQCAVHKPDSDSAKRDLRDIESMLLLGSQYERTREGQQNRLLAACRANGFTHPGAEYDVEPEDEPEAGRESCCQKIMRLCSRFPHHSLS
jgi:hypothetical protein